MAGDESDRSGNGAEIMGLDKRQLLTRHVSGDPHAFAELMEVYRVRVYTYLVRCGVRPENRDDLFQEVFLCIHRNAAKYNAEMPLSPWLFTIVANVVRTHYRREKVRVVLGGSADPENSAFDAGMHEGLEARETARWLEQQIRKLPFAQREVLVACCIKGLEHKDAAEILGVPENTLKTSLRRIRLGLAKLLMIRNARQKREVQS